MTTIDARGLACPEPVVLVQRAAAKGADEIVVLTDAVVAVENISRFAAARGFGIEKRDLHGEYELTLKKQ